MTMPDSRNTVSAIAMANLAAASRFSSVAGQQAAGDCALDAIRSVVVACKYIQTLPPTKVKNAPDQWKRWIRFV